MHNKVKIKPALKTCNRISTSWTNQCCYINLLPVTKSISSYQPENFYLIPS